MAKNNDRKLIELLPGYLQTEPLSKFFSSTVDHLFQPEDADFLTGYIGNKPSWYNSTTDFYINEPDKFRTNYQLSPTPISKNYLTGSVTNSIFYEDLLNQIEFQGGLVENHNRLFEQEYYSWAPPIDIDKFVNFNNYCWLPNGPDAIELLNTTDLLSNAVNCATYTYTGNVKYASTGIIANITLVFSSGIKIIPTQDVSLHLNNLEYIVEGVGRSIKLVNYNTQLNTNWDTTGWSVSGWDGQELSNTQLYVTIARDSLDINQWSLSNKWFHFDIVSISNTVLTDLYSNQARRPIIEFNSGIRLWNYGFNSRGAVDVVDNVTTDIFGSIVGNSAYTIDGISLIDGMRILVLADITPSVYGRIYTVNGQSAGSMYLTLDTNNNSTGQAIYGDRVTVKFGVTFQNINVWFNGINWIYNGQQQFGIIAPLFELYDIDGISLADPSVYPNSNFAGSNVFSYSIDINAVVDPILGITIELDQFGDFVFNNNLNTDIITYTTNNTTVNDIGYLFAMIINKTDELYINSWYKSPNSSRQYIINEFTVTDLVTTTFIIDQIPAVMEKNTLPTIFVSIIDNNNNKTILQNTIDYVVVNNSVKILVDLNENYRIIIKSWNPSTSSVINGYYELPLNLTANPNNLNIYTISRGSFLTHFSRKAK